MRSKRPGVGAVAGSFRLAARSAHAPRRHQHGSDAPAHNAGLFDPSVPSLRRGGIRERSDRIPPAARRPHTALFAAIAVVLCAVACPADDGPLVAVKAGRILTMDGAPVEGGTILIEDGKVRRVARGFDVPEDAIVIDATASVVMPGLVDANALFGLRGDSNEQSDEITPAFRVAGAVDRADRPLKRAVQLGTTTIRISPGNNNVVAGAGAVEKTAGERLGDVLVSDGGDVKVVMGNDSTGGNEVPWSQRPDSFYYRQPTTRMGVVWLLRKCLFDAQTAVGEGAELSESDTVLAAALAGDLPVTVAVRSAVDIETTFHIADEFGLRRLVLTECAEGYKMAAEIARRKVPVILGPSYAYPRSWPERSEGWDVNWNNAGLLAEAGVLIAIASNEPGRPVDLLARAAMAVRHGLSEDDALRAVTVNPAEILGVQDRVGSLAKGADADLLILSGDPLDVTTRIEKVIIEGRVVFDAGSGVDVDG